MRKADLGKCDECDNPAIGICQDQIEIVGLGGLLETIPAEYYHKYCANHSRDPIIHKMGPLGSMLLKG